VVNVITKESSTVPAQRAGPGHRRRGAERYSFDASWGQVATGARSRFASYQEQKELVYADVTVALPDQRRWNDGTTTATSTAAIRSR